MAFSSSKRKSLSALASSVLPTPVDPMKMKLPMGLSASASPDRVRRTASLTAFTAAVWPMMRRPSSLSSSRSLSRSPFSIRETGMPLHRLTTSAMLSASTSSFTRRDSPCISMSLALAPSSASSCSRMRP